MNFPGWVVADCKNKANSDQFCLAGAWAELGNKLGLLKLKKQFFQCCWRSSRAWASISDSKKKLSQGGSVVGGWVVGWISWKENQLSQLSWGLAELGKSLKKFVKVVKVSKFPSFQVAKLKEIRYT